MDDSKVGVIRLLFAKGIAILGCKYRIIGLPVRGDWRVFFQCLKLVTIAAADKY